MTLRLAAGILLLSVAGAAGASDFGGSYPYPVPLGLKAPDVPDDNPVTDAGVALGKVLYFKRLADHPKRAQRKRVKPMRPPQDGQQRMQQPNCIKQRR